MRQACVTAVSRILSMIANGAFASALLPGLSAHAMPQLSASQKSLVQIPPAISRSLTPQSQLKIHTPQGDCTVIVRSGRARCRESGLVYSGVVVYCASIGTLRDPCDAAITTDRNNLSPPLRK